MVLAAVTFILVMGLVVGIYWVMMERPEAREQGELRKRLRAGLVREGRRGSTSSGRSRS